MKAAEFEEKAARLERGSRSYKAARLMLVHGYSGAQAAREVGISRQTASEACRRVEGSLQSHVLVKGRRKIRFVLDDPDDKRVAIVGKVPADAARKLYNLLLEMDWNEA